VTYFYAVLAYKLTGIVHDFSVVRFSRTPKM